MIYLIAILIAIFLEVAWEGWRTRKLLRMRLDESDHDHQQIKVRQVHTRKDLNLSVRMLKKVLKKI